MAPNSIGTFLFKHQREKVKRPQKPWFPLQVNNLNIFLKRDVSKSNIDTTIDFVKIQEITLSWKLFRKIIWNRIIITLVVRNDRTKREQLRTKMSWLILRFSRKSNKSRVLSWLTGTKTSVVEKRTNSFTDLFSRCESKSLKKNIAPEPQSIFSKNAKKIIYLEKVNQVQNTGT